MDGHRSLPKINLRNVTLALNAIVIAFFLCFGVYTFIARQHLDSLARNFVTEKTIVYSKPIVEIADQAIDSPMTKKLLNEDQQSSVRNEITEYRTDPRAYIADLTRKRISVTPQEKRNPLLDKVASVKEKIRTFYDNTLNALVTDLRIFSFTNLIAGMIAFCLAYYSPPDIRRSVVQFSFVMLLSVLYCSYMYIDSLTFFQILFRRHVGWWYPVLLIGIIVAIIKDFGQYAFILEQFDATKRDERPSSNDPSMASAK